MTPGRGHVPFLLMHLRAVPWPRPARPPAARLQFCFLAWQPPEAFQVRLSGKGVQLPRTLPL